MKFKNFDSNYFLTLLFLLLSANANVLSSSTVGFVLVISLMVIVAIVRKAINKEEVNRLLIFSGVFVAYILVRFYFINDLATDYLLSDFTFLFKYILVSFLFCLLLGDKLLANVVKVVTHLTLLSFVFFAVQLLAGEFMAKTFSSINFPTGNDVPGYHNVFLFTYTQGFHDFANAGFVWEPGAFGCFLVITLMFHLFLNKFKFDSTAITLIIGNITTFATTNYLGLMVLFFLAYRYRIPKINIYLLMFIPTVILAFIFIPFLGDKIVDTYKEDMRDLNHLKVLEKWYHHNRMQIPLNRFSSMWFILDSFGSKLIMGVSNKYNDVLNRSYTVNISNGVFDFVAKFGFIGLIYLIYRYARFCFAFVLRWENVVYCVVILLILSFGEPILFLPIVMIFLFLKRVQKPLNAPGRERPNDSPPAAYKRAVA
ncbi:hypothetical protein A0256_22750 [Mucilaginibacter sp. PAMC 26640]|nr:hypothetical protein A0256_22750 [Mucilaginibacter sp. PAMC 26640]